MSDRYLERHRRYDREKLVEPKHKCVTFFRKSDGEILGVGWPLDPPNAHLFKLYGVDVPFEGQLAAEEYLNEIEKERECQKKTNLA